MKLMVRIVAAMTALAMVATLLFGGYHLVAWLLSGLAGPERTAVLVASVVSLAALVAARIIAGAIRRAKCEEAAGARRGRAAEVYARLVEVWVGRFRGDQRRNEGRLTADRVAAERDLALWGSGPVVAAYTAAVSDAADLDRSPAERWAAVLEAMRSDLGHRDSGLQPDCLLKLLGAVESPTE